ncbi:MAG: hypothetical protein ACYC1M_16270 [Armatimonadota bacterium]
MRRKIFMLICLAFMCTHVQAQYVKNKQGLNLWIDGYDMIRRVYTHGTPWKEAYELGMMVRQCEVIWLPYHSRSIRCWMFYDNSWSRNRLCVLTTDKSDRMKCILDTAADVIDMSRWRQHRFVLGQLNRDDGFILSKQRITWDRNKGVFTYGPVTIDKRGLRSMSLAETLDSVRICFTLKNARWRNKGSDYIIRFTPSGYINSRLPRQYRDTPCVQAKLVNCVTKNGPDNVNGKLLLTPCKPVDEDPEMWKYGHYGD